MTIFVAVGVYERQDNPVDVFQEITIFRSQVFDQSVDGVESDRCGDPLSRVKHSLHEVDGFTCVVEVCC